jgi:ethanolamine utilization protein EutA
MANTVKLIGLDFGTTTSSAVIASARVTRNVVTGRMELSQVQEYFHSEYIFTPFQGENIDVDKSAAYLDAWVEAGAVRPEEVFGGGALLTGLAAQKDNAASLVALVRRRLGEALIARADDPCLESWLAFMGSCADLSRAHPETALLNLDIGGGTTNLALGKNGEILRTGCLFVGARHIQVEPGTYRIVQLSSYARRLLPRLGITRGPGEALSREEVEAVLDYYVQLLEAALAGREDCFHDPVAALHRQVPFRPPEGMPRPAVTFSGGVGELIYAGLRGEPWPPPTHFGDLGIDLARRLLRSPLWSGSGPAVKNADHSLREWTGTRGASGLQTLIPAGGGRATVYGLLRHSTQISGSTLFLPAPEVLPLRDLPIVGKIPAGAPDAHLREVINLIKRSPRGGCFQLTLAAADPAGVRAAGARIAQALRAEAFPDRHPLVIFVTENVGKVLGQYITAWGAFPLHLVVIDELAVRDAQFAHLGAFENQVVPVSFYGMNERGNLP